MKSVSSEDVIVGTPLKVIDRVGITAQKQTNLFRVDALLEVVRRLSITAQTVAGITLAFMMIVTLSDIVLRAFGRPILGCYELISFSGGIVVGLAIPYTSWRKGHIYVDVFVDRLPRQKGAPFTNKDVVNIVTRCVGIALFVLIGWSFLLLGGSLYESKEVSQTLRIPFYPVAYGLGISCFIQSLLLLCDVLKILRGEYE